MSKNFNDYINELNPEQKEAALHTNGSVMVLAAAGSGKTKTLTTNVSNLILNKSVFPHNILVVTFTNKAAKELKNRLENMGVKTDKLWVGTFHGICNRIIRNHAEQAGLRKNFYIMDQQEQLSFLKRIGRAHDFDPKVYNMSDLQDKINGYKEVGWRSNKLRTGSIEHSVYSLYEQECIKENCVDFAELMLCCMDLFHKYPEIAAGYADKFKHVLVDEFQDTNEMQYAWLKILAAKYKNIFAVGDDDQCLVAGTKILTPDGEKNIEDLQVGDLVVAKAGNKIYHKKILRKFEKNYTGTLTKLKLSTQREVISTNRHAWFANLSKKHSPQKFFVYLMFKKNYGFRVGISRVHSKSQHSLGVFQRCQHEAGDKLWIIGYYSNEEDARFEELKIAMNYKILTIPFVARKRDKNTINTVTNNQVLLDKMFNEIDTQCGALKLLSDYSLDINKPHFIPRARNSNRNNITLTLCGDVRNTHVLHTLEFYTNDKSIKELLEKEGYHLNQHKTQNDFRLRTAAKSFEEIESKKDKLVKLLDDCNVIYKANFDGERTSHLLASELIPSMIMIGENGEKVIIEEKEDYQGSVKVYDIDVEDFHNFFANGVLSHNSIYSFRGAKPENINIFMKEFNAKLIKIEKNYRSDAHVLEAANAVISHNSNRQGKMLVPTKARKNKLRIYESFNDEQEAQFIAGEIKKLRRSGVHYRNIAILYRSNSQSRSLEKAIAYQNIPYIIYGGFRFFDRQEVKHAMAYLRLALDDTDNMAFLRVANFPARAIGDSALKKLDKAAKENNVSLYEMVSLSDDKTKKKFDPFIKVIDRLHALCEGKNLFEQVKTVIIESGLERLYEADKKDGPERLDNLYELLSAAEVFMYENTPANVQDFLAFSTLESNVETKEKNDNADVIKMMTVHASKGLEFDYVFVTGMEEGMFPHANSLKDKVAIEEERRLMYVAITRAKTTLYLTQCEERLVHGQRNHFVRSRFLNEIPSDLVMKAI